MRRNRLQALRIAGGGQVIAVIGAAIARAFAIGQEQPPLPRRGRGQREIVEPGAQPPMPRLDPVGKKILPRDGGPEPAVREQQRRLPRPARVADALPQREGAARRAQQRSEEHTSELQSLMRISYAVFCLNKKQYTNNRQATTATR